MVYRDPATGPAPASTCGGRAHFASGRKILMNDTRTGSKKTNWSGVWGGKGITLLVCVLLFTLKAFAGNGKLSKDLQSSTGSQPIDVIVQYATTPASKHFSKATGHGAKLKKQFA